MYLPALFFFFLSCKINIQLVSFLKDFKRKCVLKPNK